MDQTFCNSDLSLILTTLADKPSVNYLYPVFSFDQTLLQKHKDFLVTDQMIQQRQRGQEKEKESWKTNY